MIPVLFPLPLFCATCVTGMASTDFHLRRLIYEAQRAGERTQWESPVGWQPVEAVTVVTFGPFISIHFRVRSDTPSTS